VLRDHYLARLLDFADLVCSVRRLVQ